MLFPDAYVKVKVPLSTPSKRERGWSYDSIHSNVSTRCRSVVKPMHRSLYPGEKAVCILLKKKVVPRKIVEILEEGNPFASASVVY